MTVKSTWYPANVGKAPRPWVVSRRDEQGRIRLAEDKRGQVRSFTDYATAKLAAYKLNRYGKIE